MAKTKKYIKLKYYNFEISKKYFHILKLAQAKESHLS